ncbi:cation:proton antiporter [Streptosporangium lutulentum]
MALGDALIALGGSFLAAGVIARLGTRIGLPTIPLFMLAGIIFGPHTPGLALVENPADLKVIAALGLIFLLFYLGLEFSLDDLVEGADGWCWPESSTSCSTSAEGWPSGSPSAGGPGRRWYWPG